jgi:hypothetical protein
MEVIAFNVWFVFAVFFCEFNGFLSELIKWIELSIKIPKNDFKSTAFLKFTGYSFG